MSFRWKSKNSDIFSVRIPQFGITNLPETSDRCLCILGNRYNLPRLEVFLNSRRML